MHTIQVRVVRTQIVLLVLVQRRNDLEVAGGQIYLIELRLRRHVGAPRMDGPEHASIPYIFGQNT